MVLTLTKKRQQQEKDIRDPMLARKNIWITKKWLRCTRPKSKEGGIKEPLSKKSISFPEFRIMKMSHPPIWGRNVTSSKLKINKNTKSPISTRRSSNRGIQTLSRYKSLKSCLCNLQVYLLYKWKNRSLLQICNSNCFRNRIKLHRRMIERQSQSMATGRPNFHNLV